MMIWFVLVSNWAASWSCVRAKSSVMSWWGLREISFSCQAIKKKHVHFFLHGEMNCLSHPIFSHIVLQTEHKNTSLHISLYCGAIRKHRILFFKPVLETPHCKRQTTEYLILCVVSQLDRTEVIKSNLHPVFAKVFSLDYYFEEVQKLRFEVYDIHGTHSIGTRDDDFLGGVECTLGQVGGCQILSVPEIFCVFATIEWQCERRLLACDVKDSLYTALHCSGLKASIVFILFFADCGPEEDGEAFIAEVWEICRKIHHHGRFLRLCFRPRSGWIAGRHKVEVIRNCSHWEFR